MRLAAAVAMVLTMTACAPTPAQIEAQRQADQASQAGLAKALAGLTRGATSTCIPTFQPTAHLESYGPTLLYRVNRHLLYRTDTAGGCEGVARQDVLVTQLTQDRPCRGDIATTHDPITRVFTGSCSFGDFTEYRARPSR